MFVVVVAVIAGLAMGIVLHIWQSTPAEAIKLEEFDVFRLALFAQPQLVNEGVRQTLMYSQLKTVIPEERFMLLTPLQGQAWSMLTLILLGVCLVATLSNNRVRKCKWLYIVVLVASLVAIFTAGFFAGKATTQAAQTQILITPQSFTEPYNYIVFCDDTDSDGICDITYAKNGRTGAIEFSGADAGAVIQLAINALLKGGDVFIKAGVYNINSVIKLRSDTQLIGEGGTLLSFNNVDTAILLDNVYNVLIEKLKLDGGWSSQKAIVVRNCDGGHNTVRDVWIDRFFTAIRLEAIDKLVSHNVFENIYVFNGQYGIVGFGTTPDIRSVTLNTFRKFTWRGLVNGISVGIDLQQYVDNNYFEDIHLTLLYPNSIGLRFGYVNVYDNVFNNIVIDQFKENTVNIKDESNQPNWFIRVKLGGGYQTPPQIISSRFILGTLAGDKFISQSGVATICAGSTRVTVNHYLTSKPTKVLITPLGQPTGKIWVENITSTSFDIVTDVAPTSNLNVAWYAEV